MRMSSVFFFFGLVSFRFVGVLFGSFFYYFHLLIWMMSAVVRLMRIK